MENTRILTAIALVVAPGSFLSHFLFLCFSAIPQITEHKPKDHVVNFDSLGNRGVEGKQRLWPWATIVTCRAETNFPYLVSGADSFFITPHHTPTSGSGDSESARHPYPSTLHRKETEQTQETLDKPRTQVSRLSALWRHSAFLLCFCSASWEEAENDNPPANAPGQQTHVVSSCTLVQVLHSLRCLETWTLMYLLTLLPSMLRTAVPSLALVLPHPPWHMWLPCFCIGK